MKKKNIDNVKNTLIATAILTPPNNTGTGKRLINYLEYIQFE